MLETLPSEIAGLDQQPQPKPGDFVADLHPGCGLLDGDETMAVDPLEHHPVALGNAYLKPLDTVHPYLRTLNVHNPAFPLQTFFQRGCATWLAWLRRHHNLAANLKPLWPQWFMKIWTS